MKIKDIYEELKNRGIPISSYNSDLYVVVTNETKEIIDNYEFKYNVTKFVDSVDGLLKYDIPFAFNPYWERREK